MKSTRYCSAGFARLATVGALACFASHAIADSVSEVFDGLKNGDEVSLNARARYEYNDFGASEVDGYSIRTRLGYTTGEYEGFRAMIEMKDISFIDDDDRPALDVPTTELNQAWIAYQGANWDDRSTLSTIIVLSAMSAGARTHKR